METCSAARFKRTRDEEAVMLTTVEMPSVGGGDAESGVGKETKTSGRELE
jgi:hypothetical protein